MSVSTTVLYSAVNIKTICFTNIPLYLVMAIFTVPRGNFTVTRSVPTTPLING
jgi:hypothetical protein